MPRTNQFEDAERALRELKAAIKVAMKQKGFVPTLKALNRIPGTPDRIFTVLDGVVEESPTGFYIAALQTERGRLVLQNAQRTDRQTDPQLIASTEGPPSFATADPADVSAEKLLRQLREPNPNPRSNLLCAVELTHFEPSQHEVLLPLLWQYILAHRDSNDRDELIATGAAIRKYIALMPMGRMSELAVLLESGHRSTLPMDLEIEVAKMIFRNFEVHPPVTVDTQPELAQRLLEIVKAYVNPRILLRDKHSAAASLAIEAIVAMRSSLAIDAWQAADKCPYRWFAELVSDDLDDLHEKWSRKNSEAAAWLSDLRSQVSAHA